MITTYVARKRRKNGILGGVLLVLGIAMSGIGGTTILSDVNSEAPQAPIFMAQIQDRCELGLKQAGLQVQGLNGAIIATGHSLLNAYEQTAQVSVAIQGCLGFEVDQFCMGEGCDDAKIALTMKSTMETL